MRTVWKFQLGLVDVLRLDAPSVFEPLSVGMQGGQITLWARVDPTSPKAPRLIAVTGTGSPCPDPQPAELGADYIGSVSDGPFVWHVWDGGAA